MTMLPCQKWNNSLFFVVVFLQSAISSSTRSKETILCDDFPEVAIDSIKLGSILSKATGKDGNLKGGRLMRLLMDQLLPLSMMANMNAGGGTQGRQQKKDNRSALPSNIQGACLQDVSSTKNWAGAHGANSNDKSETCRCTKGLRKKIKQLWRCLELFKSEKLYLDGTILQCKIVGLVMNDFSHHVYTLCKVDCRKPLHTVNLINEWSCTFVTWNKIEI